MPQSSGESKHHAPTRKRLRDARKRGQVAKSAELAGSLSLLLCFLSVLGLAPWMSQELSDLHLLTTQSIASARIDLTQALALESIHLVMLLSAAPLAVAAVAYVLSLWLQTGSVFSLEVIKPKLDNLNPVNGIRQIFSIRSAVQFSFMLLRAVVVGIALLLGAVHLAGDAIRIIHANANAALAIGSASLMNLLLWCFVLFVLLGLLDLVYQHWQHQRDLRMSRSELKREALEDQGSPQLKQERKKLLQDKDPKVWIEQIQHASLVISASNKAVAVIHHPVHCPTPAFFVRGSEAQAQEMLDGARKHGLPCIEDVSLLGHLYPVAKPGAMIPAQHIDEIRALLARFPRALPDAEPHASEA